MVSSSRNSFDWICNRQVDRLGSITHILSIVSLPECWNNAVHATFGKGSTPPRIDSPSHRAHRQIVVIRCMEQGTWFFDIILCLAVMLLKGHPSQPKQGVVQWMASPSQATSARGEQRVISLHQCVLTTGTHCYFGSFCHG